MNLGKIKNCDRSDRYIDELSEQQMPGSQKEAHPQCVSLGTQPIFKYLFSRSQRFPDGAQHVCLQRHNRSLCFQWSSNSLANRKDLLQSSHGRLDISAKTTCISSCPCELVEERYLRLPSTFGFLLFSITWAAITAARGAKTLASISEGSRPI